LLNSTILVECIGSHQGFHIGVDHITHFLLLTLRFQKTQKFVTERRLSLGNQKDVFCFPLAKESTSVFNT